MIGFGDFGMERALEIVSLRDERLAFIDPSIDGFYDKVLNFSSDDRDIWSFRRAVIDMQDEGVKPFYKPILDPSFEITKSQKTKVVFKKNGKPAVGYSFNNWKQVVESMQAVEGKNWKVGTECQYYAFLVKLVNKLVDSGWKIKDAMDAIIHNSAELGHYSNSSWNYKSPEPYFEFTGSREICGNFDLANTHKILSVTNDDVDGYWIASGSCECYGNKKPLAELSLITSDFDVALSNAVAWLVLQ